MNTTRTFRTPALLLGVIALLLAGLTLPAQAATKTGAVKGVVAVDGKPLEGVKVELYWSGDDTFEGPRLDVDTTDGKGAYSFSKVPITNPTDPGTDGKTIVVKDPSGRIVNTSRKFKTRPGKTVTRNAAVEKAGSITGVVKRGDGVATSRLRTDVFGPDVEIDPTYDSELAYDTSVKVAKAGSFKLKGLPAGDYHLQFVDEGKTYFSQCYGNLPITSAQPCNGDETGTDLPDPTKITVTSGQNITLNPQTLSTKGRRISGTVTDTSGRPIRQARVRASADGQKRLTADTSKTGTFTVGPLVDGSYRLEVIPRRLWAPLPAGTVYDVNGLDVSGLQIKLKSLASIKASLTPGKGTAKVAVNITRSASGKKASGSGAVTKTVNLAKGKAKVRLSGLPKGKRTITVSYAGSSSTAATTKTFRTVVR
jgi:hypothetical protein